MERMDFDGKVAIVTGGAGGIGGKTAELLRRRGARVVISDIREAQGRRLISSLGGAGKAVQFVKTDVTDVASIRRLVSVTVERAGRVDILVNCAGVSSLSKVPEITPEEWDRVMAINLRSAFFCSQEALLHMIERKEGWIVNVASASAKIGGVAVGAHYSASKAGIICLTKSLALYAAAFGINVNCVCPGPTETPMTDEWGDKINTEFAERIPLKRYATAEEVAYAICFLASDEARYITGETMDVNGGLVMD